MLTGCRRAPQGKSSRELYPGRLARSRKGVTLAAIPALRDNGKR
jgi:hypothetical protein